MKLSLDPLNIFLFDIRNDSMRSSALQSFELNEELPACIFEPNLISRNDSGELEVQVDFDWHDCVCNLADITTTQSCSYYILHLLAYLHKEDMRIEELFGFDVKYDPGILFEYYLLLVKRYLQLHASEQSEANEEPIRLFNLSEDDYEQFEYIKKLANLLLNMFALASTDFRTNVLILPLLHEVTELFILQFPDALFLVALANFSERGFRTLRIDYNIYEGAFSGYSEYPFHTQRMFQTLSAFKKFPLSSFFTSARLSRTFALLLKTYGEPYYHPKEFDAAIMNVTAFIIQNLPNEEAFEALKKFFTELEKQLEMVPFVMKAISVIESEHLREIIETPEFPIHPVESQKRLEDYFSDVLTRKYDVWRIELKKLCPKKEFTAILTAISEKSFATGMIFERIFYKSFFDSKTKLDDVFNADVCGSIQSVVEHSKILDGCKEAPEEKTLRQELRALRGKIPEGILMSSHCGNKTTISAALEHLRKYHQSIHEARQAEWKAGGVALQRWESRFYDDADSDYLKKFPRYQRLTGELNQIDAIMSELQKYSGSKLLKDVRDENTKEIERVNSQIKVFDDQKHQIRLEHTRLLQEAKKSILDCLSGGQ